MRDGKLLSDILITTFKPAEDVAHLWKTRCLFSLQTMLALNMHLLTTTSWSNLLLGNLCFAVKLVKPEIKVFWKEAVHEAGLQCGYFPFSTGGEDWGELFRQPECSACPGWLHLLLAFAFLSCHKRTKLPDFPGGAVVENPPANAGDTGSSPGPGRHICRGATKPLHHSYWACALDPASHNYWAHMPQLLKPMHLEPVLCNKRSYHSEKPAHCNEE